MVLVKSRSTLRLSYPSVAAANLYSLLEVYRSHLRGAAHAFGDYLSHLLFDAVDARVVKSECPSCACMLCEIWVLLMKHVADVAQ
jgi:hypothetical protein